MNEDGSSVYGPSTTLGVISRSSAARMLSSMRSVVGYSIMPYYQLSDRDLFFIVSV